MGNSLRLAETGNRAQRLLSIVALLSVVLTSIVVMSESVGAETQTTYSATQTIPVPPASTYAGSGGGDGWAVALTPSAVYNVFHHDYSLQVACHFQSDASPCWNRSRSSTQRVAASLRPASQVSGSIRARASFTCTRRGHRTRPAAWSVLT
jgi:hypothetical protein